MNCVFTICSLQQLVDDIAEVLHLRASRDGEGDIIHDIPTNKGRSPVCTIGYTQQIHAHS